MTVEPKLTRRWLGATAFFLTAFFALDTFLVVTGSALPYDIEITTFVQQLNWGPLVYPMELINWLSGYKQIVLGLAAIVVLFLIERRAGWLMLIGSISTLIDNVIKLVVARPRPASDFVQILNPTEGFSYPSGHAVFFTWLSFMLAFSLASRANPRLRPLLWIAAGVVVVLVCLARVWAGEHWPSDVIGGVLLGIGWSAFVLWIAERAPSAS